MKLYHGSYLEITEPDLEHSRLNVDFGRGFYVTPLYEQAANWCGRERIAWYRMISLMKMPNAS